MSIAPISSNISSLIQEALSAGNAAPGKFPTTDNPGVQFGQTLANQIAQQGAPAAAGQTVQAQAPGTYKSVMLQMIDDTNKAQMNAQHAVDGVVKNDGTSLHTAIIAMEEAGVSFQLLATMRDKIVEGLQEMMRMQI